MTEAAGSDVEIVRRALADAAELHRRVATEGADAIARAATSIGDAIEAGHKVLVFGNGGSATDAEHFAAELVGRFNPAITRRGWPVVALTADSAVVTSVANDFGFENVFVRQVEAHGVAGDVAFGITTSGESANVNRALRSARAAGLRTIGLTGRNGGGTAQIVDLHVNVPAESSAAVQEVHRTVLHVLCALVEARLAGLARDGHAKTGQGNV